MDDRQKALLARLARPPGRPLECGTGWLSLVADLDHALSEIDPDYEIWQVKEKFGGLRFYCSLGAHPRGRELIQAAEEVAARTREVCGEPGDLIPARWKRTLCASHAAEHLALMDARERWQPGEPWPG